MRSGHYPGRFWAIQLCAHAVGAAFILFAGALILEAVAGRGSNGGTILLVALAIFSLFVGLSFLAGAALYRIFFLELHSVECRSREFVRAARVDTAD
jgi:hypothetical protein